MKCSICKKEVEILYLEKVAGTYIKNEKGKRLLVCHVCQAEHENDKEAMLKAIKN